MMTNDELRRLATHVSGYPYEDFGDMNSHVAASKVADEALAMLDEIKRLRDVLEIIAAPKDLTDYGYAVELARKALKERG